REPNLPSADTVNAGNARIQLYATAMEEVANSHGVPFVRLFKLTELLNPPKNETHPPITTNGIHLNETGDEVVSLFIVNLLGIVKNVEFPGLPTGDALTQRLELIRKAVNEKNFYWFNRYRVTD